MSILVITIVLLLILAGIAISQLTGNGIFAKVKQAKQEYENAQDEENVLISNYEEEIAKYTTRDNKTNYSLNEQIIGTWIDRKNIYQKTFTDSSDTIDISALSIKQIIDIRGVAYGSNNLASGPSAFPLTYTESIGSSTENAFKVWVYDNDELHIETQGSGLGFSLTLYIVTIQYTKTTD